MASALPLVALLVVAPVQERSLLVRLVSGQTKDPAHLALGDLGFGSGGLSRDLAPKLRHTGKGEVVTRGGAVLAASQHGVRIRLPGGQRLQIDERARLVGEAGPLTKPATGGLELRLGDGSCLRVRPGSERYGVREVSVIDSEVQWTLFRRGRYLRERRHYERFYGVRFYLGGNGDEVWSLVAFGPALFGYPVASHGKSIEPVLVVQGDVLRGAVAKLRDSTNPRSVQYPLAYKQATALAAACARLLPRKSPRDQKWRAIPEIGLDVPLSQEVRLRLALVKRGAFESVVTTFHTDPEATPALEFVEWAGRTKLYRVLPRAQRFRSRYMGRGVELHDWLSERLPWPLPLGCASQRKRALTELRPYLKDPNKPKRLERR